MTSVADAPARKAGASSCLHDPFVLAPGGIAPGIVGLICGISLAVAGAALVVLVLRMLLTQALARDAEAQHLRSELDEVI